MISVETMRRLGAPAAEARVAEYSRLRFVSFDRELLSFSRRSSWIVKVDRAKLEEELLKELDDAGHRALLGLRVVGMERRGGGVQLKLSNGSIVEVGLPVIATGVSGLAGHVSPLKEYWTAFGLQAEALVGRRPDAETIEVVLDPRVSSRMFGWFVPVSARRVLVGAGDAAPGSALRGLARLIKHYSRACGTLRLLKVYGGYMVRGPVRSDPIIGSSLVIGDSLGASKPYTGGGLYAISVLVPRLARVVDRLYRHGASALRRAARAVLAEIVKELRLQYVLARLLSAAMGAPQAAAATVAGPLLRADRASERVDYDVHTSVVRLLMRGGRG